MEGRSCPNGHIGAPDARERRPKLCSERVRHNLVKQRTSASKIHLTAAKRLSRVVQLHYPTEPLRGCQVNLRGGSSLFHEVMPHTLATKLRPSLARIGRPDMPIRAGTAFHERGRPANRSEIHA